MPVILTFYGIIVMMYFFDDKHIIRHIFTWNTASTQPLWQFPPARY